jgi:hypothetical protein
MSDALKPKMLKEKKQKGRRDNEPLHKIVSISEIIKLDYVVKMKCWCGNEVLIDSNKPITENICSSCESPHKLLNDEWTESEKIKFLASRSLKQSVSENDIREALNIGGV